MRRTHPRRMDRLHPSAVGRGLFPRGRFVSGICRRQASSTAHCCPVIFVGRSTNETYLVVVSMNVCVRPREPMQAETFQQPTYPWCSYLVFALCICMWSQPTPTNHNLT